MIGESVRVAKTESSEDLLESQGVEKRSEYSGKCSRCGRCSMDLIRHDKIWHAPKVSVRFKGELNSVTLSRDTKDEKYECPRCHQQFANSQTFQRHTGTRCAAPRDSPSYFHPSSVLNQNPTSSTSGSSSSNRLSSPPNSNPVPAVLLMESQQSPSLSPSPDLFTPPATESPLLSFLKINPYHQTISLSSTTQVTVAYPPSSVLSAAMPHALPPTQTSAIPSAVMPNSASARLFQGIGDDITLYQQAEVQHDSTLRREQVLANDPQHSPELVFATAKNDACDNLEPDIAYRLQPKDFYEGHMGPFNLSSFNKQEGTEADRGIEAVEKTMMEGEISAYDGEVAGMHLGDFHFSGVNKHAVASDPASYPGLGHSEEAEGIQTVACSGTHTTLNSQDSGVNLGLSCYSQPEPSGPRELGDKSPITTSPSSDGQTSAVQAEADVETSVSRALPPLTENATISSTIPTIAGSYVVGQGFAFSQPLPPGYFQQIKCSSNHTLNGDLMPESGQEISQTPASIFSTPETFLTDLELSLLVPHFSKFGVQNADDLNALCAWDPLDDWTILRNWLQLHAAITALQWMTLKDAMQKHNAKVLCHHSATSKTSATLSTSRPEAGAPVYKFLTALEPPLPQHLHLFDEVEDEEQLDMICEMNEDWKMLRDELMEKGMTFFEWLVVRKGLLRRAIELKIRQAGL